MPKLTLDELRRRPGAKQYIFVATNHDPGPGRYFAVIHDEATVAEHRDAFTRTVAGGGPGSERWKAIAPSAERPMLVLHDVE